MLFSYFQKYDFSNFKMTVAKSYAKKGPFYDIFEAVIKVFDKTLFCHF